MFSSSGSSLIVSHKFVAGVEVGETRSFSLLSLSENLQVEMIQVDKLNDMPRLLASSIYYGRWLGKGVLNHFHETEPAKNTSF